MGSRLAPAKCCFESADVNWIQLEFAVTAEILPAVEGHLLEAGCVSITLRSEGDEPILEPDPGATPLWKNVRLKALFEVDTHGLSSISKGVNDLGGETLNADFVHVDENQVHNHTVAQVFANGLTLRSKQDRLLQKSGHEKTIYLDPGLAFGSGSHATTRLCLQWLSEHVQRGQRVLDFGCGSGILALGACVLGATVTAVDHDPQAVVASRENAQYNNIVERQLQVMDLQTWQLKLQSDASLQASFDVVVANILAAPLMLLADEFERVVKKTGHIVLSGVLEEQKDEVVKNYKNTQFSHIEYLDEWVRLDGSVI